MKTPVLIAARNEAATIGRTLDALPPTVEPIVLLNGCTDGTADIVRGYDVVMMETGVAGKLPVLQAGIHYLGKQALEPLIILDADSRPVIPDRWAAALLAGRRSLPQDMPAVVLGPSVYTDMGILGNAYKTAADLRAHRKYQNDNYDGPFCGRNMLVDMQNTGALERVLDLPHIWPGEDVAIKDKTIQDGGATLKMTQLAAGVYTAGDRYPSFRNRLRLSKSATIEAIRASYEADAADGSISYRAYRQQNES